jgi:nucleoid-associated protein YgaU
MGRQPIEKQTLKNKVSDLGRAAKYFGDIRAEATRVSRQSLQLEGQVRQLVVSGGNRGEISMREASNAKKGDIIAVYVTKAGDTPQSIAKRFYKNPDHNLDILRANRLPWTTPTFRPGTILVIPQLTTAPRSA